MAAHRRRCALATDEPARWERHKFVWREAGATPIAQLVGNTLAPPLWEVRYATFDGDVAERAEEWRVTIDGDGAVRQVRHALPEARPGARLSRDEALRARASARCASDFGLDPAALKLTSAPSEKRAPARTDWTFTFADPRVDVGKDGEARVVVSIAGDEVVGARALRARARGVAARRARARRPTLFARMALAALLRARRARRARHGGDRLDARAAATARALVGRRVDRVRAECSSARRMRGRCSR